MGVIVAEVGSILASAIAGSSLVAAIAAWLKTRKKASDVQITVKRGGKTVVVKGDMSGEELQRILDKLAEDPDTPSHDHR
ncbi:hypothetical protein ACGFYV_07710 [Streptomyces sp. NPDC048297]|uniref:effector-associated constant component EACC1 n=1 Tax=Streptomyces sp. NPDC048297 TaxID=3365531 RepID=UPI003715BCE2